MAVHVAYWEEAREKDTFKDLRLRHKWKCIIKTDTEEEGWESVDWIRLVWDTDKWQTVVSR